MRFALALAAVIAATAPAAAQDARDLSLTTKDLVLTTRDLEFTLKDLDVTTKDLAVTVEDLIRVKEAPKEISIELAGDILFDFDKTEIRPEAAIALTAAADLIRGSAKGTVRINGHTDAKGTAAYNQKLSLARAKSVRDWLMENGGLGKTKFTLKGLGATKPVAPNAKPDGSDDPAGRQLNRRVEIVFARK